jgi:hypothetical protein
MLVSLHSELNDSLTDVEPSVAVGAIIVTFFASLVANLAFGFFYAVFIWPLDFYRRLRKHHKTYTKISIFNRLRKEMIKDYDDHKLRDMLCHCLDWNLLTGMDETCFDKLKCHVMR